MNLSDIAILGGIAIAGYTILSGDGSGGEDKNPLVIMGGGSGGHGSKKEMKDNRMDEILDKIQNMQGQAPIINLTMPEIKIPSPVTMPAMVSQNGRIYDSTREKPPVTAVKKSPKPVNVGGYMLNREQAQAVTKTLNVPLTKKESVGTYDIKEGGKTIAKMHVVRPTITVDISKPVKPVAAKKTSTDSGLSLDGFFGRFASSPPPAKSRNRSDIRSKKIDKLDFLSGVSAI